MSPRLKALKGLRHYHSRYQCSKRNQSVHFVTSTTRSRTSLNLRLAFSKHRIYTTSALNSVTNKNSVKVLLMAIRKCAITKASDSEGASFQDWWQHHEITMLTEYRHLYRAYQGAPRKRCFRRIPCKVRWAWIKQRWKKESPNTSP